MRGFTDGTRAVLKVGGADARALLQDLVTNDLDRLESDDLIYAALLTPQGKYLFDFLMFAEGEAIMIDVAADRAPALAQRLTLYKLRRDMEIAATDLAVALLWGDAAPPEGARRDPRDPALGWRLYAEAPALSGIEPATPADYDALRVALAVPATGAELQENDSYILEQGFERLGGVDFRKGCYVGQEVTSRMKHKTDLKKGLVRVRVEGASPGAALTAGGRPAGVLHTVAGAEGLAHLRFDRAGAPLDAEGGGRVERIE
ncbi:MAG: folate-binding protein [Pseudomonadota bacterium]